MASKRSAGISIASRSAAYQGSEPSPFTFRQVMPAGRSAYGGTSEKIPKLPAMPT